MCGLEGLSALFDKPDALVRDGAAQASLARPSYALWLGSQLCKAVALKDSEASHYLLEMFCFTPIPFSLKLLAI